MTPLRRRQRRWLVLFLVSCLPPALLQTRSGVRHAFAAEQSFDVQSSPTGSRDLLFEVGTRNGQRRFYIGEVIPLELRFSSTTPDRYRINTRNYDRGGRATTDRFLIEPETGWTDPLADNLPGQLGGVGGVMILSVEPTTIEMELNEWVRFDRPGTFRIQVTTPNRIEDLQAPGLDYFPAVEVVSNALEIEILDAPSEWQEATLASALEALDDPNFAMAAPPGQPRPGRDAVKTLRYLGTPAAAREMARRLKGADEWDSDFRFGLIGSPARSEAVREMERLLADPDFPVAGRFVWTLAALRAGGYDQGRQIEAQYWQTLASLLDTKQGQAQTLSAGVLAALDLDAFELPTGVRDRVRRVLAANFESLPVRTQLDLVRSDWPDADPETMLPLLERLARRNDDRAGLAGEDSIYFRQTNAEALRQWYRLAPEAARQVILDEIARPEPRFGADVLGILPDETLPELETTLGRHLIEIARPGSDPDDFAYPYPPEHLASLVARYATRAVEPEVLTVLDRDLSWRACEIEAPLIAYLLRVNPAAARPHLEASMVRRVGASSCFYGSFLVRIADLWNHPVLEEFAIENLQNTEPRVVQNAAEYLQRYGSDRAEEALWNRFSAWSAQWRARDLRYRSGEDATISGQALAGASMLQALGTGHGWVLDQSRLLRLLELSVGDRQRRQVEQYLEARRRLPWAVRYSSGVGDEPRIEILHYVKSSIDGAKEKLSQFPQGTAFRWMPSGRSPAGEEEAFQELSAFALTHGIAIERPP